MTCNFPKERLLTKRPDGLSGLSSLSPTLDFYSFATNSGFLFHGGGDTPKTKARMALFVVLWEDDVDGFSELLAHCRSQVNYKTHEPVYDH